MSEPIYTTRVQRTLPDVLRPLFARLVQQALAQGELRGLPIDSSESLAFMLLPDESNTAWIEQTSKRLRSLLHQRSIPAELAPLIDLPLLTAIVDNKDVPKKPKASKKSVRSKAPEPEQLESTEPAPDDSGHDAA